MICDFENTSLISVTFGINLMNSESDGYKNSTQFWCSFTHLTHSGKKNWFTTVYSGHVSPLSPVVVPQMNLFTIHGKGKKGRVILTVGFAAMMLAGWLMLDRGHLVNPDMMRRLAQDPWKVCATALPAPVRIDEVRDIEMIGCWPRIQGDPEMDTSPGDYVPVRLSSNIYIDGEKIILKVFYRIEEDGGDHTVYSGARTFILFENDRPGYHIATVELRGPRLNNFILYSAGVNTDFRSVGPLDSYWETLEYRVDSPDDDQLHIGVRGRLSFTVVLERTNAIVNALTHRS
jgi:hypothetical protein|nr:MAG: hypothetical protein DIU61_08010 [Bacteroidota bacterium]